MALTKSVSLSKLPIIVRRSGSLPSPPDRLASSMPIDEHFEGSLTEKEAYHGTGEESIKGGRCTYIFFMTAWTGC